MTLLIYGALRRTLTALAVLTAVLAPDAALACACGCGVFEVGTSTMIPNDAGGNVWLEYDFMNQSQNWHGTSRASADNNNDKQIRTDFITVGGQYMFNRSWGIMAQVPYWDRHFKTMDDDGNIEHLHTSDFGDVRLRGVYSGFSDDMSTGVTFGLKLPTGQFNANGFDRDTQIGTGSTDLLLGVYHVGALTWDWGDGGDDKKAPMFNWFANLQTSAPVSIHDNYRPGDEISAAVGTYYNHGTIDGFGKLTPLLQVIASDRERDRGINADPDNSGYRRLLISPGLEYDIDQVRLYGDVGVPVYQNFNGNQLTAPVLLKFIVGYSF
jgi:hypothetical protein